MSDLHKLAPLVSDLEANVVGAILSAASLDVGAGHRLLDKVRATGLEPEHFYRQSLGRLFAVLVRERDAGRPLDPLSISYALEHDEAEPHTRGRLEVLAREPFAFSPAPHWATLVVRDARRRADDDLLARYREATA